MPESLLKSYILDNKAFCERFDLNLAHLKHAKDKYRTGDFTKAVYAISESILNRPFVHPVSEASLDKMASIINRDIPKQCRYLKRLADNYWLKNVPTLQGKNPEEELLWFTGATETPRKRGAMAYGLLRLFHLTGDKAYLEKGVISFKSLMETIPPYHDTTPLSNLGWQPWGHKLHGVNHNPGHIMQELCLSLPFMRNHISPKDFLSMLRGMILCEDVFFRSNMTDVMFNIPLHFLTAAHMIYVSLPELKTSKDRKQRVLSHIVKSYKQAPHVTSDGYFNEGTMYQAVVQYLLLLNHMYIRADKGSVPASLRRVTEKAFAFSNRILRNDGFHALIGDARQICPHEYAILPNQVLPLAASIYRRKDFMAGAGNAYNLDLNEQHVWLMGEVGYKRVKQYGVLPVPKRTQQPCKFISTQFSILGCGKGLDSHHGLLHAQPHVNHAHFDLGHVDIFSHGRLLISDPGISSYAFPDVSKSIDAQSHNTLRLGRYSPAGPRLHLSHYSKATQFAVKPNFQISTVSLTHYEGMVHTRSLVLCDTRRPESSFWLVLDKVQFLRGHNHHLGNELGEVAFHFNAPETTLGLDESRLTCWSRHTGKNRILTRYGEGDFTGAQKGTPFKWKDRVKAALEVDNNANLQITGLLPDEHTNHMDIRSEESFTHQYGQVVKRPAVKFYFDCELPLLAVYVLVPFKGIRKTAYARVTGLLTSTGGDINIQFPTHKRKVHIAKANSQTPLVSLK